MSQLLFHYCNADAFLKIIESKELWASDLSKMNDPDELKPGKDIISNLYSQIFPDSRRNLDFENSKSLACSFSKDGDVLSQWRAYGGDGTGFSIGADSDSLTIANLGPGTGIADPRFPQLGVPRFGIYSVFYDATEYKIFFENLMKKFKNERGTPFPKEAAGIALSDVLFLKQLESAPCLLKHGFYKEEQEVRVFSRIDIDEYRLFSQVPTYSGQINIRFRSTRFGIKPYVPVKLIGHGTNSIRRIIIGPRNDSSIEDIEFALFVGGIKDVEVVKSNGNYR